MLVFWSSTLMAQVVINQSVDTISTNDSSFYVKNLIHKEFQTETETIDIVKEYYLNGKLKAEYTFINDFIEGEFKEYYSNGSIRKLFFLKKGNIIGHFYEFYPDGTKKLFGHYSLPNKEGDFILITDTTVTYDSLNYEYNYLITSYRDFIDIKDGIWYYWNKQGDLLCKEYWEKGVLLKTEEEK
jgi:antitoxin component YwqK of YwqJK toxin-antitoxin module